MDTKRPEIWLIGGAAGVGKTMVAYPLAIRLGVPLVEIDDVVEALLAMTSPLEQPDLHYWRTHPEAADLPADEIVRLQIAVAEALGPAIEAVIANHLETDTPVVIEGDYLLPSLAAQTSFRGIAADDRVRSVFLIEPDEDQLVRNFAEREPAEPTQAGRARVSRLFGEWLADQAGGAHQPVVAARPWTTVLERVLEALPISTR
jgi:2-phosphoglycerate kinase